MLTINACILTLFCSHNTKCIYQRIHIVPLFNLLSLYYFLHLCILFHNRYKTRQENQNAISNFFLYLLITVYFFYIYTYFSPFVTYTKLIRKKHNTTKKFDCNILEETAKKNHYYKLYV